MANHERNKPKKPPRPKKTKPAAQPESKRPSRLSLWLGLVLLPVAAVATWYVVGRTDGHTPGHVAQAPTEQAPVQQTPAQTTPKSTPQPTAQVSGDAPKISFPEPAHDFGTVVEGAKVTHRFVVRNIGNQPLKLLKATGG